MNKQNRISLIFNSQFLRNTSALVTGTTIAQLIPILIQPLLRRYYSAEVFGAYAVYLAVIGVLYGITSLRYEQAIIHPKNENEADALFYAAIFFNIIISTLLFLLLLTLRGPVLSLLNLDKQWTIYLLFAPLGIFLFNLQQSINLWLIRRKSFTTVSKMKVIRRGTESSIQLTLRFLKVPSGLLIGDLLGHVTNIFYGFRQCTKNGLNIKQADFGLIKRAVVKYVEYPKYNALSAFLNAFALMAPVLIVNRYYGTELAGYYDLARLLLLTPAALLAGVLSNVMLQRVAEKRKKSQNILKEVYFIIGIGVLIAIIELFTLHLFGEELFVLLFGQEWSNSGSIAKVLVWPYLGVFFTISLGSTLIALNRIRLLSIFQLSNFILVLCMFLFTHLEFPGFLKIFAILSASGTLLFFGLLLYAVKTQTSNNRSGIH